MVSGFQSDGWYDIHRKKQSSAPSGQTGKKKGGGGGGGGKKSRLGKTGARSRSLPKESGYATKRTVIIKAKYDKTSADSDYQIQAWLTYCSKEKAREHGGPEATLSRDEIVSLLKGEPLMDPSLRREAEFFSATREGISRNEAIDTITANKGKEIADYRIILSPGDRDIDPYDYARDQMSALEKRLGHKLVWVGNVHRDTGPDQAHINVTIAGKIPGYKELAKADRLDESRDKDSANYVLDLDKVAPADKIHGRDRNTYTKFDSLERLHAFSDYCNENRVNWIPKPKYQKLWKWIGTKTEHGENVYGKGPQKILQYEIDLDRVPDSDKILIGNRAVTPYHTSQQLEAFRDWQDRLPEQYQRIAPEDRSKLQDWLSQKSERGEDCFGEAPMREKLAPPILTRQKIDYSKVPESQRINLIGRDYTRFDTSEDLLRFQSWASEKKLLSDEKSLLLQGWIDAKSLGGEEIFGKPPLKDIAIDRAYVLDTKKIPEQDKIQIGKETWSKYSSAEQLVSLLDRIESSNLPKDKRNEDLDKIGDWLYAKESNGHGFEQAPPLREIIHRQQELQLDRIPESQRVVVGGNIVTKYHQLEVLKEARIELERELDSKRSSDGNRDKKYDKEKESEQSLIRDYELLEKAKLQYWIELKEQYGETVVGNPPVRKMEIDLDKISKDDRVYKDGRTHTKYDSSEDLLLLSSELGQKEDTRSQEQKGKVDGWLKTKEELGRDDVFGEPPLKKLEEPESALDTRYIKEPLDRTVAELLGEGDLSVGAVNLNRALDRYDRIRYWEQRDKEQRRLSNDRGDVYLDRDTLNYLRERGNEYIHAGRSPLRELDRAVERNLTESRWPQREQELELANRVSQLRESQIDESRIDQHFSIEFNKEGEPYLKQETIERLRNGPCELKQIPAEDRLHRLQELQRLEASPENKTNSADQAKDKQEREDQEEQQQQSTNKNALPDLSLDKSLQRKNMIDSGILQLGQMNDQNSEADRNYDDQAREHEDGLHR